MPFKEQFHHLLTNNSEIVFDALEERYSLPSADFCHSSISVSQEIQDKRSALTRPDEASKVCLDSYHRLVSHLGKLALEGTQLSDLYQNAGQLLVQELKLMSCEFWEILTDQDTLNLVDYTTSVDISVCPRFGFDKRSLKQILQESQVCHEVLSPSKDQHTQLLSLESQRYGLIIPGKSYPAGLVIFTYPFQGVMGQKDVDLLQDVTSILASALERKRAEMLLLTQTNVLQAIASGSNLQRTLFFLCQLLEQQNPGAYCSVLFLDTAKQKLESGIAPSLPQAYAAALNGLVIGDCAGSCGTAAFRGEPIFVHDISTDPLWAEYRDLALSHGIRACWSMPFLSQSGNVLGTFALSFEIPCQPTTRHLKIMETATHLASIATERFQSTQKLTRLALYDDLTDLVNRSFFTDFLASQLEYKHDFEDNFLKSKRKSFALLFLDLDRFKLVNDSLGHMVGDQLLIAFTKRVLPYLKSEDVFCSFGGR
ncbi:MAG: diguanylate cyclase [Leptolyngbya sp. SIOISBB]|nr:diguanylate cyclase [Leptolyngbya sp. SIOISBB]